MKTSHAVLGKIASSTLVRIENAKQALSIEEAQEQAIELASAEHVDKKHLPFENALAAPGLSFICEVKKASPSKGIISGNFPWLEIAKDYEEGGASAISVLTEPEFFLGSDQYLREISAAVKIPTLRKDFIIDKYQIYEAKLLGAKAILLICALLDQKTLSDFIITARALALDCLVEIHNEEEAQEALSAGAHIIGINNRDLTTFDVDTGLSARLKNQLPPEILTVAESGIKTADDIRAIKDTGVDAVLIGESLMRAADRKAFLRELVSV